MRDAIVILFLAFLLVSTQAQAYELDPWSQDDLMREILAEAVIVGDWQQTLNIARNPQKYSEVNPILGPHPSSEQVNSLFWTWAVMHPLITWVLPREWRDDWQWVTIGIEGTCFFINLRSGL